MRMRARRAHSQEGARECTHNTHCACAPLLPTRPPGFLILYYVGVVQVLQQLGIVTPGQPSPPVAGISSGALTAGVICSGISAETFHDTARTGARGRGVPGARSDR